MTTTVEVAGEGLLAGWVALASGKTDWATVDVHDVEAFLASNPAMR